jgi:3-isopropylmalate dehydrogenase
MDIVILPGDGIGPETMEVTTAVLSAVDKRFALRLNLIHDIAGLDSLKKHGTTVTPALLEKVNAADGLVLGPMSTLELNDESKGEINSSKFFRKNLDLFANIRPSRTYPGLSAKVGEFDLVVVRENTEGFYADRNMEQGNGELLVTKDVVVSMRRITRECCLRVAESAFALAQTRRKHVSIVHKANVLRIGDGMFIDCCKEVAKRYPEVVVDDYIVDAMMAHAVRAPQKFDVIVTTNMFGDILSDLTAELSGSLGLGASLNAGFNNAMAQASHGSAPDIAGQNIANPFSLVLSAGMLLSWYGRKKGEQKFINAHITIEQGVAAAIASGEATRDVGGKLGTRETGAALVARLSNA